jgi:mRNA-degrading endonuclease RelE of RelBE toxin-antitoxin system
MDELQKLFRKLTKKERNQLVQYSEELQNDPDNFNVKKLKGSDFYRARKGRWRFIFHYEGKGIVIDNIRLRDEKTYRDI